ncbi:MAG: flavin reductase family protein [Acidiferrobacterales bacterium]|nr:flavin reductase family protein [Acidiferrobacterales bacterium]
MTQTLVPRPIAWVLSDNGDNSYNVAPFSFFTGICSDPPLLVLSIGKKDATEEKDTRVNIRAREKFVVHIPSTRHIGKVNQTSVSLAHGDSEVEIADLELCDFEGFSLPRIKDCDIALACRRYRIDEIGNVPQAVIYGEIISLYVNDERLIPNDKGRILVDASHTDPLSRLGGSHYSGIGNILSAIRPK